MSFFIIRDLIRKQNCIDFISTVPFSPVYGVRIEEYKKNRSGAQNRTFHMWVKLIADYTGYDLDTVKDKVVLAIYPPVKKVIDLHTSEGKKTYELYQRRSTSEMTVDEMQRVMQELEIIAAKLNIVLPYPDDYLDR